MKLLIWFLAWFLVLTYFATAYTYGQLYPLPEGNVLLGELKKDCYGPAISCDGTGKAFHWRQEGTQNGPNVIIQPNVNAYGFGRSSDQFGRSIEPQIEQKRSFGYQAPKWDWKKGGFTEAE